jgi:hypothetical protein
MQTLQVSRGDKVDVDGDEAYIERYGFEDERQHYVEEQNMGSIRIVGKVVLNVLGAQVPGVTYYHGQAIVPSFMTDKRRILDVGLTRLGGAVSTSSITEAIASGIGQSIPFPIWGGKKVPIIEPARSEPGFFVQYTINKAGFGYSGSTASVDESQEFALSTVSIKVKFSGYE